MRKCELHVVFVQSTASVTSSNNKYYLALADLYSNLLFFNVKYVTNKFYDILLTKIKKKCK